MEKDNENSNEETFHDEEDWEAFFLDEKDEEWEKEKQRKKKIKAFWVKFVSSLIVFSLLISGLQLWFNVFNIPAIRFLGVSNKLSNDANVKEYKKSIAVLEWDGKKGTGFVIQSDGLIVTNEHVVEHTNKVNVHFNNGSSFIGKVISKNKGLDLAIIDIDADDLPFLQLSDEKNYGQRTGEKIIFIGNPLSFTRIANEGTIEGEVLLLDWEIPVIMIDAPVYKGNSGSPVLNSNGEVIGVIFATISLDESNKRMGAAVPSFYVNELIND